MPPLSLSTLSSNILSSNTILPQSLHACTLNSISPPKRGIFAILFSSLSPLTLLTSVLNNVAKAWAFIHPRHQKNLAIAQNAVNQEWREYHSEEWRDKVLSVEFTTLSTFAKQKPISYCLLLSLKSPLGSPQQAFYNGLLRIADKPFYEEYKDILGEAMEEDIVRKMFEVKVSGEMTEDERTDGINETE